MPLEIRGAHFFNSECTISAGNTRYSFVRYFELDCCMHRSVEPYRRQTVKSTDIEIAVLSSRLRCGWRRRRWSVRAARSTRSLRPRRCGHLSATAAMTTPLPATVRREVPASARSSPASRCSIGRCVGPTAESADIYRARRTTGRHRRARLHRPCSRYVRRC